MCGARVRPAAVAAARTAAVAHAGMPSAAAQKIMRDFSIESERMDLTEEIMSDAVDGALEGDEDADEEDRIVDSVLEELNIKMMGEVRRAI